MGSSNASNKNLKLGKKLDFIKIKIISLIKCLIYRTVYMVLYKTQTTQNS